MQSAATRRHRIVERAQKLVATCERSEECEEEKKPSIGIKGGPANFLGAQIFF